MKRIIELSENDYMELKEDGVQNHLALADTVIAHSVPYEERSQVEPEKIYLAKITFDKEQLQEIVDKAKEELLASIERPDGKWIITAEDSEGIHRIQCPFCRYEKGSDFIDYITVTFENFPPFCESCGAELKGGTE